ncbi:MAG: DUF1592 domain-containing protein [Phycisphaera sp. RhM]|nr:DUF1592 domain-containing protein [Phycisphaera sp. RhM]
MIKLGRGLRSFPTWLRITRPCEWTPAPIGPKVTSENPTEDARRLLWRFVDLAAREPVSTEALVRFEQLIERRLKQGSPFPEAMLAGYKAFLCSSHFLYLREPSDPATGNLDQYAVASRLSHFLTNTRPDPALMELAAAGMMRDADTLRGETDRLINSRGFARFVQNFTDYWLDLRNIRRDEPDM